MMPQIFHSFFSHISSSTFSLTIYILFHLFILWKLIMQDGNYFSLYLTLRGRHEKSNISLPAFLQIYWGTKKVKPNELKAWDEDWFFFFHPLNTVFSHPYFQMCSCCASSRDNEKNKFWEGRSCEKFLYWLLTLFTMFLLLWSWGNHVILAGTLILRNNKN